MVIRGHSWSFVVTRGHSWSFVVTRGHSCVLLDKTIMTNRLIFLDAQDTKKYASVPYDIRLKWKTALGGSLHFFKLKIFGFNLDMIF